MEIKKSLALSFLGQKGIEFLHSSKGFSGILFWEKCEIINRGRGESDAKNDMCQLTVTQTYF